MWIVNNNNNNKEYNRYSNKRIHLKILVKIFYFFYNVDLCIQML